MATIDYMIASYGPYAASATGGNGLARDFLAGVAAMYSMPCKCASREGLTAFGYSLTESIVYTNVPAFGRLQLVLPTIILACLAFLVTIPIFVFYWKGPAIRARSKFAQSLACDRKAHEERRRSAIASATSSRAPSITGVENKDT